MGASLLDDVLAETLDPAYAQAAQARAARGEDPATRRRWPGRLAVALTMGVAGLLGVVTYDLAAARDQGRQEIRETLVQDIRAETEAGDELTAALEELRAEVDRARDELLASSATGQRALDALAAAEAAAGVVPVSGPGLLVTLANAEGDAADDPVSGDTASTAGRVRDGDLQLVVNALWAAGAEAISINGQRLAPTSAIRFAGEAVLVDFQPVTNPYEVSAIGNPDAMSNAFLDSPEVSTLAQVSKNFGLRFTFAKEDELRLPAAGTPELRDAAPAPRDRTDPTTGD